jgi:hypothetical protein
MVAAAALDVNWLRPVFRMAATAMPVGPGAASPVSIAIRRHTLLSMMRGASSDRTPDRKIPDDA